MDEDGTRHDGKTLGNHLCTFNLHLFAISVFDCVTSRHCSTPLTEGVASEVFIWLHKLEVWVEGPDGTQLAEARGSVST